MISLLVRFLLLALVLPTSVSFATFRMREHTAQFPKSTTLMTPFDAFEPETSTDVQSGASKEGIHIGYLEIGGNALLWFSLVGALMFLGTHRRSHRGS